MSILIITYDLKSVKDYTPFYDALKDQGPWWHYMASTWLIDTTKNPQQVWEALHPHMDQRDFILVSDLGPRRQGWLPKKAWDWINSRIQQQQTSFHFNPPNTLDALNPPFHKTE